VGSSLGPAPTVECDKSAGERASNDRAFDKSKARSFAKSLAETQTFGVPETCQRTALDGTTNKRIVESSLANLLRNFVCTASSKGNPAKVKVHEGLLFIRSHFSHSLNHYTHKRHTSCVRNYVFPS
jgi:hypothetical protein